MPHLPRVPAFPIAGERSLITAAGAALKIPAKERPSPLIGRPAPEIFARDHLGRDVSLHATIALGRPIVLYFFPLAGSPHCTKESCSFRDAVGTSPIFNDLNAVVIGISQDPPARSKRFVDEHHLGFRILHDSNRQIMDAWGVGRGLLGLIDGRCTFVIDHAGVVRAMLDGVWDYKGHRDFAEKWLCRIEHELSGRERFYVEHEADESVACDDEAGRNVRVMYGDVVPARGIATAPRFKAAPSAVKVKASKQASSDKTPLSLAAEANANEALAQRKSRRNLKNWLRPADPFNGVYDEPLHVDYKHHNRSVDDVTRRSQSKVSDGTRSADKLASRIQSMRLDQGSSSSSHDHAPVTVRDFADRPPSRHGSGSGSGWATPSTISARSVSTGETSHASPGPESHALKLAAAISSGIAAAPELERSGSSSRRRYEGTTKVRSSSAVRRAASGEADAPVYANGNIAKMPLHVDVSHDSMLTVQDRRVAGGGEASVDSAFSARGDASLPVPPRPSTRNGAAAATPASSNTQQQSGSATPSPRHSDGDGYETDQPSSTPPKRVLPPQPTAPSFAPPPPPGSISPSTSLTTTHATVPSTPPALSTTLRRTGHPSPCFGTLQHGFFESSAERRTSATPSLTPSSIYEPSLVESLGYSPSLAGSTHTFGGVED